MHVGESQSNKFLRSWNISGRTWLDASIPGPWAVDNSLNVKEWSVINTETGKDKRIGPVTGKGINYFDRAMEEANKRNLSLLRQVEVDDAVAKQIISDFPDVAERLAGEDASNTAKAIIGKLCEGIDTDFPADDPDKRDALIAKIVAYRDMGKAKQIEGASKSGEHLGPIISVTGNKVVQSAGRGRTVTHDARNLDVVPKEGDKASIKYNADGKGTVTSSNEQTKAKERGR